MTMLLKTIYIYRFNAIPVNIPATFLMEIEGKNPSNLYGTTKTPNNQSNPEKKEQCKRTTLGITLPNFKLYYKTMVIKTIRYWQRKTHRQVEQNWEPRDKPTHIWATNFHQRRQKYTTEKESFQWCWENWKVACKRMKLDCYLTPHKNELKVD